MAFGLGFNKTKVLSSAEKYVQQGKLQNAIAEYEKVLKHDSKDLTVLNTVGDLHARLGQPEDACNCFKTVGDAYAQQGFTVKAIAMYKKLTKLRSTLEGVLKLAELYTQQGLFNDARQQYLQVAEEFLRTGELEQAVRIFQKTLEMDPENVAMKVRLAEVYVRLGKKKEAWQIFSSAAEQLRARGQLVPAEDILQRMLTLDPKNNQVLLLRGKNAMEAGDSAAAINYFQQVPDIDTQPEALKALFHAYLAADRLTDAGVLATKLLTVHNDIEGISGFVAALMKGGLHQDALNVYHQYADRLLSLDQPKVLENLHTIIGHVRSEPECLELLLELFQKAGETTHISEVTELLAHASVQKGDLDKARELYQQLMTVEPQNPIHAQNYQQVTAKLEGAPRSDTITVEQGTVILEELEATAPAVEQGYPESIAAEVRAALTDAELFVSYNMPAKALGPLIAVLPKAPQDIPLNQRLAALHTRAGRFAEAAACCRSLEKVYSDAGYAEESGRYGELATRYEQRSGTSPAEATPAEAPVPSPWPTAAPAEFATEPVTAAPADEEQVGAADESEIDLSEEWEGALTEEPPAVEPPAAVKAPKIPEPAVVIAPPARPASEDLVPETVEEVRFYLQHTMRLQALAAMAKLEALTQDQDLIATLRAEYEAAFAPAPAPEPVQDAAVEEVTIEEEPVEEEVAQGEAVQEEAVQEEAAEEVVAASATEDAELIANLESELADFEPPPEPIKPKAAPARAFEAAASAREDVLGEFVADLESSLGDDFLAMPPAPRPQVIKPQPKTEPVPVTQRVAAHAAPVFAPLAPTAHPAPAAVAVEVPTQAASHHHPEMASLLATGVATSAAGAGTDLIHMFDELKDELEEDTTTTAAEQDPETHYNLGVAFREMGLLDEAIGELQKVCQLVDRGHPFPQLMQTYTWLAQCFLDKAVPEAAVRWYERALKISSIDEDTRTALHYELATAYENAHNRDAALSHFMEVYGNNIDYRDVAERIKALKS
ncbi:MAG TPA: tetratricopeptide repeat protein [Terriglobales bacterium]|nr:tetratricopeptide repeat protein [Terriglobales bacterium]